MRSALADPSRRVLLLAAAFGIGGVGALHAMYGPAFPGLMARFGVGVDEVGTTVVLHFGGAFVATVASPWLLARFGYRSTVVAAGGIGMVGAAAVATAPAWAWLLVGAALAGMGFGLANLAFNLLVARVFASAAAPALNLLSAVFGLGALAGPAAVGAAGGALRGPFLVLAAAALAATVLSTRAPVPAAPPPERGARPPWAAAVGFSLLYALYLAVESSIAAWETVHLTPSLGASRAAFATGLFWAALTAGRLAIIPVAARIAPRRLVAGSAAAGLAALAATHVTDWAPVAYAAAGLAFAPIFPTGLAWIERVFPRRSERIVPIALAVATFGPMGATAVIGAWVARTGPEAIPTALTLLAAALTAVVAWLAWGTRRD